jgi:hypothetical protein
MLGLRLANLEINLLHFYPLYITNQKHQESIEAFLYEGKEPPVIPSAHLRARELSPLYECKAGPSLGINHINADKAPL